MMMNIGVAMVGVVKQQYSFLAKTLYQALPDLVSLCIRNVAWHG